MKKDTYSRRVRLLGQYHGYHFNREDKTQMSTVRPHVMALAKNEASRTGTIVREYMDIKEEDLPTRVIEVIEDATGEQLDLAGAEIIVSGAGECAARRISRFCSSWLMNWRGGRVFSRSSRGRMDACRTPGRTNWQDGQA